jgi:hypothetical protein
MVRTSAATMTFALLDGYELRAGRPGTVEMSCPGRVMRLDPTTESSVGEFMPGHRTEA